MADSTTKEQCSDTLLIEIVKNTAVLASKFEAFEKSRQEDNVELKESVKKVDEKVDKLDSKIEGMKTAYDEKIRKLQEAPLKDKADKFERYTKLVIETIIAACLMIILAKIGLK